MGKFIFNVLFWQNFILLLSIPGKCKHTQQGAILSFHFFNIFYSGISIKQGRLMKIQVSPHNGENDANLGHLFYDNFTRYGPINMIFVLFCSSECQPHIQSKIILRYHVFFSGKHYNIGELSQVHSIVK